VEIMDGSILGPVGISDGILVEIMDGSILGPVGISDGCCEGCKLLSRLGLLDSINVGIVDGLFAVEFDPDNKISFDVAISANPKEINQRYSHNGSDNFFTMPVFILCRKSKISRFKI